jgi:hypothetical protein
MYDKKEKALLSNIVVKKLSFNDGEATIFFLPSGFKDKVIRVYEDFIELEVSIITKKEAMELVRSAEVSWWSES